MFVVEIGVRKLMLMSKMMWGRKIEGRLSVPSADLPLQTPDPALTGTASGVSMKIADVGSP